MDYRTPQNYSFTLFLSFDLDVDSAEVLKGEDPVALSRGRFALKRGVDKVLKVLEMFGVKSTFFVPGWVIERYKDIVEKLKLKGHEIAVHGYLHEKLDKLSYDEEAKVFNRMIESAQRVLGLTPKGFRAPYWRFSHHTLGNLLKYGFTYDSSLMDDEKPYVIEIKEMSLVELPVDWRLDDWVYLEVYRCTSYRELLEMWIDEMDYAHEVGGYLSLTMHPQCIGRGARVRILEGVISEAVKRGAWIPKGEELAEYTLKLFGKSL